MTSAECKRKWKLAHPKKWRQAVKKYKDGYSTWLVEQKNAACKDCGGSFDSECMDFDHVRGRKLFNIGANRPHARSRVLIEIAKCDLVCSNCHRLRTKRRRNET